MIRKGLYSSGLKYANEPTYTDNDFKIIFNSYRFIGPKLFYTGPCRFGFLFPLIIIKQ